MNDLKVQASRELKEILQGIPEGRLFIEPSLAVVIEEVTPGKEVKSFIVGHPEALTPKDVVPKAKEKQKGGKVTRSEHQWSSYIYLVRPTLRSMNTLACHIHSSKDRLLAAERARMGPRAGNIEPPTLDYHVIFVPRDTLFAQEVLIEHGVMDHLTMHSLHIGFLAYDEDLLSLGNPESLRECTLYDDETSLFHMVLGLLKIQHLYGVIPILKGKGTRAGRIIENLVRETKASTELQDSAIPPQVAELIVIDRKCDYVSPLLTQITYEGLLDEVFGIENNKMAVSNSIIEQKGRPATDMINYRLSTFQLYDQFRDLLFSDLGEVIQAKGRSVQEGYDKRNEVETIQEVKTYMGEFKGFRELHASLQVHLSLATAVRGLTSSLPFKERIDIEHMTLAGNEVDLALVEDMIASLQPLENVLRIISLICVTRGGIKPKRYAQLRLMIEQAYGYESLFTLTNLERVGLVTSGNKSHFDRVRKTFDLGPDAPDPSAPKTPAYVFGGYYPLSVKIAELMSATTDMKALEDRHLKAVPGGPSIMRQQAPAADDTIKMKIVLFVGGVCTAEVAALRILGQLTNTEFLVASTHVTNGFRLVKSFFQDLDQPMDKPVHK